MGFRAVDCAAPHQQAVAGLLDRISDMARAIGAVNVIFREDNTLLGENTDGRGIVQAVARETDPKGKRVVLLRRGTGGPRRGRRIGRRRGGRAGDPRRGGRPGGETGRSVVAHLRRSRRCGRLAGSLADPARNRDFAPRRRRGRRAPQ